MPPRPLTFLPQTTFQRADALDWDQKTDHDIWNLGFEHRTEQDIHALGRPGTPIPGMSQPQPLVFPEAPAQPEPLPIVVSPRPEIQQPKPPAAASGTPSAMPSAGTPPTLVDATITTGPRPGQTLQPGETVGDITLVSNAGTRASRFAREIAQVAAEEGVPADVLAAILDTENSGETSVSPAGARGLMQVVPGQGFDREGEDASDPLTSIRQGARALKEKHRMAGGDWDLAGRLYFGVGTDAGGVSDNQYHNLYRQNRMKYQGQPAVQQNYPERAGAPQPEARQYGQQSAPQGVAGGPNWRQTWGDNLTPNQIDETLNVGLSWDAALATCGVAAAVAFARANGRNPTFKEALDLAQSSGEWDQNVGMKRGSTGQVALLRSMGVDATARPLNEDEVARTVSAGQPVQINAQGNGGHFYVASGYNPETRQFFFGNSASILKASGGRQWFRLDELSSLGVGTPSEAIYIGAGT